MEENIALNTAHPDPTFCSSISASVPLAEKDADEKKDKNGNGEARDSVGHRRSRQLQARVLDWDDALPAWVPGGPSDGAGCGTAAGRRETGWPDLIM